uniref:NADH-ubiquinone oxidoreductase chain 2 n=1 Tax=Epigonichthys maldivensis TaxID=231028 RepID=A0A182C2R4_9BRAN|nr:NADH dehydrogenase subunit 2 [Epigonichthys maldivensis]
MSPYISPLFSLGMFISVMLILCSSHWIFLWMGLELGTLAFVPMLAWWHTSLEVEATVKYFIVQALAAATFFFGGLMNMNVVYTSDVSHWFGGVGEMIILLAVAVKLGMAPFHYWVVDVVQGLNYIPGLVLLTWQKLPGLAVFIQLGCSNPTLIAVLGCLSALVGGLGGLGQTQLRKLLAFSSIVHLGWLVTGVGVNSLLGMTYFVLYVSVSLPIFLFLHIMNVVHVNQLRSGIVGSPVVTALLSLGVLSLAGLPPFVGFLGKWLVLTELVSQTMVLVSAVLISGTLVSLYYYLRVGYLCLAIMSPQQVMVNTSYRKSFIFNILAVLVGFNLIGLAISSGVSCYI